MQFRNPKSEIRNLTMQIVVFEDEHVSRLYPVTVGRPAYAISCGSYRLIDWLAQAQPGDGHRAAGRRAAAPGRDPAARLSADQPDRRRRSKRRPCSSTPAWCRRSRAYRALQQLLDGLETAAVYDESSLAAAMIGPAAPPRRRMSEVEHWIKYLHNSVLGKLPPADAKLPLFDYPHDLVRHNLDNHRRRAWRTGWRAGGYREIADGVFAAEGATLGQYCVTDTSKGPVLLDDGATVGPYCFLRGPAYLGPKSRVIEHSAIKDAVSLGHTTKIGGEVEASIVEPYTNKQHHGFLGHSYLGSWINLGAGTCNSDLKNTYGTGEDGVPRRAGRHRHAVRRLHHGRLCQDGDQHGHLHRQDHRLLLDGLWLRDDQRAQLRQLRPPVRPGHRAAARSDGRHAAADVRPPQRRRSATATSP